MKKLFTLLLVFSVLFTLAGCDLLESKSKAEKELEQAEERLDDALEHGDADAFDEAMDDATSALDDLADEAVENGEVVDLNAEDVVDELIKGDDYKTNVESFKSQGLLYTLEARGNYIAYVYQYTVDVGDTSVIKAGLDKEIDMFRSVANSMLKAFTGIDGVIFEYLDYKGSVIATYTFD